MYIEPNTNVKFYNGIVLDNTYSNSIYFENTAEQLQFFHHTLTPKHIITRNSYQRVNKGIMRVEIPSESLYDCTYMAFQNVNYGQKWFYAFITSIEYVNDVTSEVRFEIDEIQSYINDISLHTSYIERQHSETDNIGDNIVGEPIGIGEYITDSRDNSTQFSPSMNSYTIVIASSFNIIDETIVPVSGVYYGGLYSGVHYYEFSGADADRNASNFLEKIVEHNLTDGIVSVFMVPTTLWGYGAQNIGSIENWWVYNNFSSHFHSFDGYTNVKNNKLYTFPYNVCYLSDVMESETVLMKPELISNLKFTLAMSCTPTPSFLIYPQNYNGLEKNQGCGIWLHDFPQCAFTVDSYKAWVANGGYIKSLSRGASAVLNGMTSVTLGGGSTGSAISAISEVASTGLSIATEMAIAKIQPPRTHGTISGTPLVASKEYGVRVEHKHCRPQYLQIIDDFFTMFGYAQNKIDVPNLKARPHFTYIKTRGLNVSGGCPASTLKHWREIFDNGITFWRNGLEIGNYELNNSPS